jgi:N-acetylneuraminic acid mutarotase
MLQANEEIILFGGEFWDQTSNKIHVYDDLYKYNPGKSRWTHIRSPGPQARSACAGAVYRNCLYIFGGEFTSPNQEKFRHFRCGTAVLLWRL